MVREPEAIDTVDETISFIDWPGDGLLIDPLLGAIAAQAAAADETRSVSDEVIALIKANPVMGMTASRSLGGLDSPVAAVARELGAVAQACTSTAWCLWNHLCTWHFFCGLLGPEHAGLLAGIVANREWVSFPAGASTRVKGELRGEEIYLEGTAAFGSGARYGEWAGVGFVMADAPRARRFTLVDLRGTGVEVEPTWKAMSLRASATDHVHYRGVSVPAGRNVPFPDFFREVFRDPGHPVIDRRYREDWVALSDLWLGAMAVGLTAAALAETAEGIRGRVAIAGVKMIERPTIHVNLGQAGALVKTAADTVVNACEETDARIETGVAPTETDYLRQTGAAMQALACCDDAMRLVLRVLGGNGLREGSTFERRYRDFQAMPLHINAHRDRVSEQIGRHLLGLEPENPI